MTFAIARSGIGPGAGLGSRASHTMDRIATRAHAERAPIGKRTTCARLCALVLDQLLRISFGGLLRGNVHKLSREGARLVRLVDRRYAAFNEFFQLYQAHFC